MRQQKLGRKEVGDRSRQVGEEEKEVEEEEEEEEKEKKGYESAGEIAEEFGAKRETLAKAKFERKSPPNGLRAERWVSNKQEGAKVIRR